MMRISDCIGYKGILGKLGDTKLYLGSRKYIQRAFRIRKRMKWFFAFTEETHEVYANLFKVAVLSARKYTTLEPYCIYDGNPSQTISWLEERGVTIIYHKSSLDLHCIRVFGKDFSRGTRGALLRIEIPVILSEMGISDKYVLYTDCDVMFMKDVDELVNIKPKYFAAAPEFDPQNWSYVNSGVMLLNVKKLFQTYDAFVLFIRENMNNNWIYDQTAYNLFYGGKITKLPVEYNWKPYWGDSQNKKIIHFHGPKPFQQGILENGTAPKMLLELYEPNQEVYKRMFGEFREILSQDA